ncbi:hypothetical protein GS884_08975, partial [Rhodococcus hoagii]|nr:hypothetical protein [Prescottella equi]
MVESALLQDSAVRRAAVTAVDGALVAFVCGDRIDPEEVLRAVTRTLPPTSVPSRLHVLDLLPTTSNGKTDFRSLTELARELADTSSGRPLSGTESVVAAVVSDVLGHRVDVDAGFFAVGGHSLAAVEVAGRWRSRSAGTSRRVPCSRRPRSPRWPARSTPGPPPPVPNSSGPTRSRCRSLRHSAGCGCSIAPNPTVPTTSCRSSSGSANPST